MISVPITPTLTKSSASEATNRRTLTVVFLYFVIAGAATVMLGPALPLLASRWSLGDAQLGTLFVASYAGQVCGAWMAARRPGLSLLFGAVSAGGGFLLLATAGIETAHVLLFVIGMGLGAGLTAGNVVVGTMEIAPTGPGGDGGRWSSRSKLLALLNVSWGVGAIACPLWLRASLNLSRTSVGTLAITREGELFLLGLGVTFAAIAAMMLWLLPWSFYRPSQTTWEGGRLPWRLVWMFVLTLMLYVGVENALAGWLPTYAQRLRSGAPGDAIGITNDAGLGGVLTGRASSIALCFWVSQLVGRGLMALLVKPEHERPFYRGCLLALIATIVILVTTPYWGTASIFVLTAVVALSLSPLFPLAISFLLERTGNHPRLGRIFASASLGGSILPWLTGVLSTHFQSLRIGFVAPGVGAVLLLLLSARLSRDEHAAA
jgi:MFS transporter, FHS family, glucose/mannose:H+ symporter